MPMKIQREIYGLPDMLQKLNNLTEAFVNEFNHVHQQGYALGELIR